MLAWLLLMFTFETSNEENINRSIWPENGKPNMNTAGEKKRIVMTMCLCKQAGKNQIKTENIE